MGSKESLVIEIDIMQNLLRTIGFEDRVRLNYLIRKLIIQMELSASLIQHENKNMFKQQIKELRQLLNKDIKDLHYMTNETHAKVIEKALENVRMSINTNLVATKKLAEA